MAICDRASNERRWLATVQRHWRQRHPFYFSVYDNEIVGHRRAMWDLFSIELVSHLDIKSSDFPKDKHEFKNHFLQQNNNRKSNEWRFFSRKTLHRLEFDSGWYMFVHFWVLSLFFALFWMRKSNNFVVYCLFGVVGMIVEQHLIFAKVQNYCARLTLLPFVIRHRADTEYKLIATKFKCNGRAAPMIINNIRFCI